MDESSTVNSAAIIRDSDIIDGEGIVLTNIWLSHMKSKITSEFLETTQILINIVKEFLCLVRKKSVV